MANNRLKSFPVGTADSLLTELYLTANYLTDTVLVSLQPLLNLKILHLGYNDVQHIADR